MRGIDSLLSRKILALLVSAFVLAHSGCSQGKSPIGKTYPVSGKVTVDGQPLTTGTVSFKPDYSKGNVSKYNAFGTIDSQGNYKLVTTWNQGSKEGAPPGWYKVSVSPMGMSMSMPAAPGPDADRPFKKKYENPDKSGISIEVVESSAPGAYDLKLTK